MANDPGQQRDVAAEHPQMVNYLHAAYAKYWVDVSRHDQGRRGRPIIGTTHAPVVKLCGEDWFTTQGNGPRSQGSVATGAASFSCWPVRFASAGTYRVELRRWPRELDAPLAGVLGEAGVCQQYEVEDYHQDLEHLASWRTSSS